MLNFEWALPTKIIFGRDAEKDVGARIAATGAKKVLLHYGGGSIKRSGLYDTVMASLSGAGLAVVELGGVQPNPRLALVYEGIALCKRENVDFILAVGGGSAIDSAKGISVGAKSAVDVWEHYIHAAPIHEVMPLGVILTIPAAGSETSKSSVVTKEDENLKRSIGNDMVRPLFAIMNPELCYTLPPYQIACGVADIMAHMMERYFTQVEHVELTSRMGEACMRTVVCNAMKVYENPQDYDAWAEIMLAGTMAHNDLLSNGRVGDWSCHQMEHELSGYYDVAHGAGLAALFPAWMKKVYTENVGLFAQFAQRVFHVEIDHLCPENTALAGIATLEDFFRKLGLPLTLHELGIPGDKLALMAKTCKKTNGERLGFFRPLSEAEIEQIYRSIL